MPPAAPPPGRSHPSFPYSAPPGRGEAAHDPYAGHAAYDPYAGHDPYAGPEAHPYPATAEDLPEAPEAPAGSGTRRRVLVAVVLIVVLVVGVLVGRLAVAWATTGVSPLGSLLGAGSISLVVDAPTATAFVA